jgi:hypothetical protein
LTTITIISSIPSTQLERKWQLLLSNGIKINRSKYSSLFVAYFSYYNRLIFLTLPIVLMGFRNFDFQDLYISTENFFLIFIKKGK